METELFFLLFIAFAAIISGLVCLVKASGLIYINEENRRNTLIIISVVLLSFGMALFVWSILVLI
jgi:hypothetical protein